MKFRNYIDNTEWPDHMNIMPLNQLQSTVFDKGIQSNNGNEHDILQSLHDSLERLDTNLVRTCDLRLKRKVENNYPFRNLWKLARALIVKLPTVSLTFQVQENILNSLGKISKNPHKLLRSSDR